MKDSKEEPKKKDNKKDKDSRKDVTIARWRDKSYIAFSHIYNGAQELQ
jgi:hypothetical protein